MQITKFWTLNKAVYFTNASIYSNQMGTSVGIFYSQV